MRRSAHEPDPTRGASLTGSAPDFRLLVQSLVDYAIFLLDPGGFVINWNVGAQRITGYAETDIVGQHVNRFYTWDDRVGGSPARTLDTVSREDRHEAECWYVRKDGSRFWAAVAIGAIRDDNGNLLGFIEVIRDITEQRRRQNELRESDRQLRLFMNGVTDYALIMLDLNGIITSWNAGAERIKGYKAEEIIGHHFARFYTEADRVAGLPARSLLAATTQGRSEMEARRVRKDGSTFWAHVVIDAIHDENGKHIGFAKITRDITERLEAQHALQEAQAQLAQAQKMEALGQLTGGVAHDFNNLLMVVSGYIHTIKERCANDAKAQRAAEAIERAAQRGETLTRQLLSFSRRQNLQPAIIDPAQVLETILPMLAGTVGAPFRVVQSVARDLWPVRIDLSELELALINLAANARDAMGDQGVVTIAAENVAGTRDSLPPNLEGEFVAISVADTGCGIPPDVLSKVFDPFFTTKGVGKGTGLGLSQVHGFAHQAGGTVTIRSVVGTGTSVTIYLPRARAEAAAPDTARSGETPSLQRNVLLVEDNPEVAAATCELLLHLGCQVELVSDAAGALRQIRRPGIDIVMTDIVMPGPMNGLDLARAIRERKPELPVLLATGYSAAAADAAHEFFVLRKPYSLSQLADALAATLHDADRVVRLQPRRGGLPSTHRTV